MNKTYRCFAAVALALFALAVDLRADDPEPGHGKKPLSRDQIEELQQDVDAIESMDAVLKSVQRDMQKRYMDCYKSIGHAAFCECIKKESPSVSFTDWVRIVTSSREELGYAKLDALSKKVVDRAYETRDTCVTNAGMK